MIANDKLRCLSCHGSLVRDNESFVCKTCSIQYAFECGVPAFKNPQSIDTLALNSIDGQKMSAAYKSEPPTKAAYFLHRVITSEYFPLKEWQQKKEATVKRGNLLVIGSGTTTYPDATHLDLDAFPGVDVIADACHLPFKDACFDAVLCEVVLEHVYNPWQVIEETHRVLKPGGSCFFIVPFLFPYHGHPNDYRRWSKEGMKAEFSAFNHIETGIHGGPCSSMVNLLSEWIYILSGLTYPKGYTAVKGLATALLFPIKFLDRFVNSFPESHRLASTFYLYAEKPE
ncbi:MAG: hypothetical protein CR997_12820 [Acidobacteria bacterium]|nr:MAG: hypothetical protein CR997_12820 [Acidobacteriota bacterium]